MGSNPTPRTTIEPHASKELTNFVLWLRDKRVRGRRISSTTIDSKVKIIGQLSRKVNLWNKEAVKEYVQESNWTNGRRNNVLYAYQDWCKYQGFDFKVERYPVERRLPYIPTEQQLDQLVSSASNKYAPFLQLAKESGWRPIEISRLTPQDFDLNQQIATLNKPAKNSLPRQIKMSNKLKVMIKQLVLDTPKDERIWKAKPRNIEVNYIRMRNKASEKFGDSDITKITLKTFRHFKATLEYHRTKDILYVQKILGHKNIQSTLIYTHLVEWEDDNWIVKVAEALEEAVQLLEAGFEYVTDYKDKKQFRKRK